ncbi:MAG: hypothetical protein AAGC85_13860 [Bacteroidota bacterium]
MMNTLFPLLCLIIFCQSAFSQTEKYNLSFQNRELGVDNTFCVDLALSFDQQSRLGSSNLVFSFDSTVLRNPRLVTDYLEDAQSYLSSTLTKYSPGKASLNIELSTPGEGEVIQASPYKKLIGRVCFDRVDMEKLWGLTWYKAGTVGTIVYKDDELTKLEAETLGDRPVVGNPVNFISFNVTQEGNDARLEWGTVEDSKNSTFEIERSIDEVLFSKVGEVDGENITGEENTYEFMDIDIREEQPITFFYRIKQIELDGAPRYSEVVSLTLEPADFFILEVNPNPFGEEMNISFKHSSEGKILIKLVSPLGKVLYTKSFEEKEGEIRLDASGIPAGFLYLLAESEDYRQLAMKKVAKIR